MIGGYQKKTPKHSETNVVASKSDPKKMKNDLNGAKNPRKL